MGFKELTVQREVEGELEREESRGRKVSHKDMEKACSQNSKLGGSREQGTIMDLEITPK